MVRQSLLVAAFLLASAANATLIVIEPDDYPIGTVLNPPGASMSFMRHDPGDHAFAYTAAIVAREPTCGIANWCAAPTGTQVLSDGRLSGPGGDLITRTTGALSSGTLLTTTHFPTVAEENAAGGYLRALRIDFDSPTDFFSADLFSASGDDVGLWAFSSDGTLLDRQSAAALAEQLDPCSDDSCRKYRYSISTRRTQDDISFILVGSMSAAAGVDAIRYEVPEPSTLLLMGGALLGMLSFRRLNNLRRGSTDEHTPC